MFRFLAPPPLLDAPAHLASCEFDEGLALEPTRYEREALLPAVPKAVPKRVSEFLAARRCARALLEQHAPSHAEEPLLPEASRAARWPEGWVGSLTHTQGYAAAALAPSSAVAGLGIDTERLLRPDTVKNVRDRLTVGHELTRLRDALALDEVEALTLLFSAKESLYKALWPQVRRYFDFQDAELRCTPEGAVVLRVRSELCATIPAGYELPLRFARAGHLVHTAVLAPREPQA